MQPAAGRHRAGGAETCCGWAPTSAAHPDPDPRGGGDHGGAGPVHRPRPGGRLRQRGAAQRRPIAAGTPGPSTIGRDASPRSAASRCAPPPGVDRRGVRRRARRHRPTAARRGGRCAGRRRRGRRPTWWRGPGGSRAPSWPKPAARPAPGRRTRCGSGGEPGSLAADPQRGPRCRTRAASCARWRWRAPAGRAGRALARPVRRAGRQGGAAGRAGRPARRPPDRQRTAPAPGRAGARRPPWQVDVTRRRRPRVPRGRRRLRPGAAGRAVHRAGRAAPPAGGALAARPSDLADSPLQPELLAAALRLVRPGREWSAT